MNKIIIYFALYFFISAKLLAQEPIDVSFSNTLMGSSSEQFPFWFWVNQDGNINPSGSFINLSEVNINVSNSFKNNNTFKYNFGTDIIGGVGDENYFRVNKLFAGIQFKHWIFKAGLFHNKIQYNQLSSTNGDIHWSNNTRPLPRISLTTNNFISFAFFPEWLKINGIFEEGLLNDNNRYVQNAHLHHKHFFFGFQINPKTFFTVGLDHYSMWGGNHPILGQLPAGVNDYFRYILGLPGSEEFTKSDQNLMAGNQLGKYVVKFNKQINNGELEFYLNHPFTDRMDYSNYKDNLMGVYFKNSSRNIITSVLYEFMFTKYQRVKEIFVGHGYEPYFEHGIYKSGLSYHNQIIATPFAIPMVIIDGVNYGTGNNRIILHHIGVSGFISEHVGWKSLLSFSKNYGTYSHSYDRIDPGFFVTPKQQLNLYSEVYYYFPNKHWLIKIAFAADKGELLQNSSGLQFSIKYKLL